MRRILTALYIALALALMAVPVAAQQSESKVTAAVQERITENHLKFTGGVELQQGDTALYADEIELFRDEDRAVARGNVVFSQGQNRISADRADFNTRTRLGTFYTAYGIANIKPPTQPIPLPTQATANVLGGLELDPLIAGAYSQAIAPQETDVYFFGDTIEKVGPKKYKITNGGFTTCVQPTPRWDLHADTVVLNIDDYTLVRQAIFKVKGVPLLYVPIIYYPTNKEDRATGFLLPTYGSSSVRGHMIHNAFFWAINRSHDATIFHDWFSRSGLGAGTEYRYNISPGSEGTVRSYFLNQREVTYALKDGGTGSQPGSRSYEIRGNAVHFLASNILARGAVNYFSSLETMKTFSTNIYEASRNQRSYGGNVVASWRHLTLTGNFDRSEWFQGTSSSAVTGGTPRIALRTRERPLFSASPVYFSHSSEFSHVENVRKELTRVENRNLSRIDLWQQVRYPFKTWPWFTVNSSLGYRDTYYTRSYAPGSFSTVIDPDLHRRFYVLEASATGPVFSRVWDTPNNAYAERFKHLVEPYFNIQRTSSIDNFNRIVKSDGTDSIVGDTTSLTYGIGNRFFAKRRIGLTSQAQEIISVELFQTYYTNKIAAQFDSRYATSFSGAQPSNFSPIVLSARASPLNTTIRAEIDGRYRELRTLTAQTSVGWNGVVNSSFGWSQRFFVEKLEGFNNPDRRARFLNVTTNVRTRDNRLGTTYSLNYDALKWRTLQQRITSFYNAQCCGIAFEYQRFNFGSGSRFDGDSRFFLSFTLAGLGNFSPFNGAMGAVPR